MLNKILLRIFQSIDYFKEMGFFGFISYFIYWNKTYVSCEIDLSNLKPPKHKKQYDKYKFIRLSKDEIQKDKVRHPYKSRYFRMITYLSKGYDGFALVKNDEIIGDLWCIQSNNSSPCPEHSHFKLLDIKLKQNEAYLFDMYIDSQNRGGGLSNYFLGRSLSYLKEKGIKRCYGVYFSDNIAARWMHSAIGYKQREKITVKRFLTFRQSDKEIEMLNPTSVINSKSKDH